MAFLNLRRVVFSLIVALVAVPVLSYAQVFGCSWSFSNACTPGTLHVYVLVLKNDSISLNRVASDFVFSVRSQQILPTFQGSQSGTHLSVAGDYVVEAQPAGNYTPNYSVGCTGSVQNGGESTCVVTMTPNAQYLSTPQPYPYAYTNTTLACTPAYQTVRMGETARFVAVGGVGTYSWSTTERTHALVGPVFNFVPRQSGVQTVQVTSGTQTAQCTVNVIAVYAPVSAVTAAPATVYTTPVSYTSYTQPSVSSKAYYSAPALPNTGFAPQK